MQYHRPSYREARNTPTQPRYQTPQTLRTPRTAPVPFLERKLHPPLHDRHSSERSSSTKPNNSYARDWHQAHNPAPAPFDYTKWLATQRAKKGPSRPPRSLWHLIFSRGSSSRQKRNSEKENNPLSDPSLLTIPPVMVIAPEKKELPRRGLRHMKSNPDFTALAKFKPDELGPYSTLIRVTEAANRKRRQASVLNRDRGLKRAPQDTSRRCRQVSLPNGGGSEPRPPPVYFTIEPNPGWDPSKGNRTYRFGSATGKDVYGASKEM